MFMYVTQMHSQTPRISIPKGLRYHPNGQVLHARRAIDAKNLSVDPFAILRSKEADDTRNIDRKADPVQWRPASGILIDTLVIQLGAVRNVLAADGVVHVRLDASGGNGVNSDLLVTEICTGLVDGR
jgi:hypothetical protein